MALGQTKTNSARFPIPRRPLNRTNDISPFYFAPALPARLHRAMSNEQREMRTKGEIFETITEILHIQCVHIQKHTTKIKSFYKNHHLLKPRQKNEYFFNSFIIYR